MTRRRGALLIGLVLMAGCKWDWDGYKELGGPVTVIYRNGDTTTCTALRSWAWRNGQYECLQPDGKFWIPDRHVSGLKSAHEWSDWVVTWRGQ